VARPIPEVVENRPRESIDVEHRTPRKREVRNPERATNALARRFPARSGTKPDFYTPHQRAHLEDVEVRERTPKIADKTAEEPRPVLPFQRNLLVMNDD
jgi:type IV secretory pathway ATPase VirB11/archaellum biosynthesis ATPase